jgi:hypothetical protein
MLLLAVAGLFGGSSASTGASNPATLPAGCFVPGGTTGNPDTGAGLVAARSLAAAGFVGTDLVVAVAVARAESGWNPTATHLNSNGTTDYGLMQINSVHAALFGMGDWRDPAVNARMAFTVWQGSGWGAWSTYTNGMYAPFMDLAGSLVTAAGSSVGAPVAGCGGSTGGSGAWGGFSNGQIPLVALCPVSWAPGQYLRCDAERQFEALDGAYRIAFGSHICITDSYRTYAQQVALYAAKPNLAAKPGTSNHGWALAVDLCGGLQAAGTPQDAWFHANAPKYGWIHPAWAEPGGSRAEAWHWSFGIA